MTLRSAMLVAILSAATLYGFAENSSQKTPYYRPKVAQQKQRSLQASPRASSGAVVVNAASYLPGITPGGLATIFGENLTTVSGVVFAGTDPLPLTLSGVSVLVNGEAAPIYGIAYAGGQDQISFQVPYDTATGLAAAEIEVVDFQVQVADFITDSYTEDPGVFTYDSGLAIATHGDYSLVDTNNPTFRGEYLTLYTTGLGPLDLTLTDGYGAPDVEPFARTIDPSQVLLDGEQCLVIFSGLAPGFVGLYQVDFQVPEDAAAGNLDLQIQTPYASSNIASLPVE
ncbi:MAG TPA: hypothetical protein VK708_09395 [Bryobacteraceae bacterium]|jgi:uncharacterized protein (TIGR03437 family)|nr:hypothetical protein [Bryobacteraceae bacterium]